MSDCGHSPGEFPWPPANVMAMSAFHSSDTDIRWDDPAILDTGPDAGATAESVSTAVAEVVSVADASLLTYATGTLQVVNGSIAPGSVVEVDGVILTAVDGPPSTPDEFDGSSPDSLVVTANLLAAITGGSVGGWQIATATANATLITLTAVSSGEVGNDITLLSTSPKIVPSGSTFTGGSAATTVTIGGVTFTAASARTSGDRTFDVSDPLKSLAAAINDPANGVTTLVRAEYAQGSGCVRIFAYLDGSAGNGIPLSTSSVGLIASAPYLSGGSGVPCPPGRTNSGWNILGVNIYRSDTGERGPYFRVNQVPVQTQFYRDRTDIVHQVNEVVAWDGGWLFKGDSPNNKGWRLKTRYNRVVKRFGNAVPANAPVDVLVTVDGVEWPAVQVFGPTGEIDLTTEQVWDVSTDSFSDPPIPDETSEVLVTYYYQKLDRLVNTLDQRHKVFYRVTTIVEDPFGTSPSGLIETPLGYSPPVSPMDSENLDYIWKEAIRRNRWILEQGGERVKLFIRRVTGIKCRCVWDPRLQEYSKQPMNMCLSCFGTGYVGGYEGPYDIIIGPDDSERRVTQTPNGRRLEHTYEVWIGRSPRVSQRDFIVKQNGERYSIGPVRRTQVRGVTLQQSFSIGYLDSGEIRYRVPMGGLEMLPWPETRFTNPEDASCVESEPFPVGCDPQATPMATEAESISDGRELRGRTPVWQNIMYGSGKVS